jgi:hypothetical protein
VKGLPFNLSFLRRKSMLHLIKINCRKVMAPTGIAIAIISIFACALSAVLAPSYSLQYELESWEIGTEFLSVLYSLFVVIPLCWNLYYERKDNFLLYIAARTSLKRYLFAKWISYAVGAVLIIVVPSVISAFFVLYIKEPIVPFAGNPFSHIFAETFINAPWVYVASLSLWRGVLGVLMTTFGFVLALFRKNIFVILVSPFVYSILENFILAILRLERYRLVTAFDPVSVTLGAITPASFAVGPALLLITIGATALALSRKNKILSV